MQVINSLDCLHSISGGIININGLTEEQLRNCNDAFDDYQLAGLIVAAITYAAVSSCVQLEEQAKALLVVILGVGMYQGAGYYAMNYSPVCDADSGFYQ